MNRSVSLPVMHLNGITSSSFDSIICMVSKYMEYSCPQRARMLPKGKNCNFERTFSALLNFGANHITVTRRRLSNLGFFKLTSSKSGVDNGERHLELRACLLEFTHVAGEKIGFHESGGINYVGIVWGLRCTYGVVKGGVDCANCFE